MNSVLSMVLLLVGFTAVSAAVLSTEVDQTKAVPIDNSKSRWITKPEDSLLTNSQLLLTPAKPSKQLIPHVRPNSGRAARQIGYGGVQSGIGSRLQGISSGYGYGYNNAVGLGGQGSQAGTNLGVFPGFIGRR